MSERSGSKADDQVYVQEGAYDGFVKALKRRAETCAIGQPEDEKTSFGPLVCKPFTSPLTSDLLRSTAQSGVIHRHGQVGRRTDCHWRGQLGTRRRGILDRADDIDRRSSGHDRGKGGGECVYTKLR